MNNDQVALISRAGLHGQIKSYDLTPHDYLMILLDARRAILLITFVSLLIGASAAFLSAPVFTADSLIKIREETNTISALEKVNTLFGGESQADAEIEFVNSRRVIGKAVENLQLDIVVEPRYFPFIGDLLARRYIAENDSIASPLFGLESYCWGGERLSILEFEVPDTLYGITMTLLVMPENRYRLLDPDGSILLEGIAGQPSVATSDGKGIKLYVRELHAREGSQFKVVKIALLDAIKELKESLKVAEIGHQSNILQLLLTRNSRVEAARILNELVRIYIEQNTTFRSVEAQRAQEFLEGQLPMLRLKVEESEKALNDFRFKQGSIDLPTETQGILKSIVSVESQITELSQNREELRQKFTPKHPSLLALDSQIYRLRNDRKELELKVKDLPETQQQILNLSRDVEVATKLYLGLLENVQELRIANASTAGSVQVIDHAVIPIEPTKPKKLMILLVSLFSGLLVSVVYVFLRQGFGRNVSNSRQMESGLYTPVIEEIPASKTQAKIIISRRRVIGKSTLLASIAPDDPSIKALRNLQLFLDGQFRTEKTKVIVLTGSSTGVGTSFISANLAVLMADAGDHVCLIDANFINGGLRQYFSIDGNPGLSEFIQGNKTWKEVLMKTSCDSLHLISSGLSGGMPQQKQLKEKMQYLIRELSDQYERIIIDTSSLDVQTYPVILGRLADLTMFVTKAGKHSMSHLESCVRRLRQGGIESLEIVLNNTRS